MSLIADFHLHIYPQYDLGALLSALQNNLIKLRSDAGQEGQEATFGAFLTERYDCDIFTALRQGELTLPPGVTVSPSPEPQCVLIKTELCEVFLFAGRQINTKERIELLAVTVMDLIPDGLALTDTLEMIRAQGGIPAINWAPGKWLFGRGTLIRKAIINPSGPLLLCDTSLRPNSWNTPKLMALGANNGLKIIAGTDPLPFSGQETIAGSHGSLVECNFNPETPVSSIRQALSLEHTKIRSIGQRITTPELLVRLWRLKRNSFKR